MLVLSRKKDEKLIIADGAIVITVVEIRGDKVRLGIEAPPDISIHREEVWDAIQKNRQSEKTIVERGSDGVASYHPET